MARMALFNHWMEPKETARLTSSSFYGVAAAVQAVQDSGWMPGRRGARCRTGVMIGSGIGGLQTIAETAVLIKEKGETRQPVLHSGGADQPCLGAGLDPLRLRGPNHAVVTACATGARYDRRCGAADRAWRCRCDGGGRRRNPISEIGIAGFNACKALSTKRAEDPQGASRPWDADRDGFVMGEGAGCVVLEEYEHAKARGADLCRGAGLWHAGRRLSHAAHPRMAMAASAR